MPLRVCAITSSRADWGLLAPVLAAIRDDAAFDLEIVVTGQHLASGADATQREILADGFAIADTIDMHLGGDTPEAVTASLAAVVTGCGKTFARRRPDLLLVLGDRYEILGAVTAAALARIPVAHIAGGDVTEGAVDEAFRHAMTKMSHLHFVTTEEAGRRVRQMGEDPARVVVTGSPGLDRIRSIEPMDRAAFFEVIGLKPGKKNLVVTFHPETLALHTSDHCAEMLAALDSLGPDVGLLFSGVNADVDGRTIHTQIADFVAAHGNAVLHSSLGSARYFSALKHCDAVVGNSSSGLYEAPSFHIPTVNIGDRQKGRARASSVIDVAPEREAILAAIRRAFTLDCRDVVNPYGDGHAASRIVAALKRVPAPAALVKKRFFDWPAP
jgi:UDP-hydrolysing UDP-N-acetyl-D-glucosamine 2-epimerase